MSEDCRVSSSRGYPGWLEAIQARARDARIPLNGQLELTYRCNYDCVHCYCNEPAGDKAVKARELTTAEAYAALDQMREAGCIWLLLTGGEALLRPDFKDVWIYAKRSGFLLTLFTNASLLTEELAALLAEYPPFQVEVTLYGATRKTYEAVTKLPGSFDRCWKGIKLILKHGLPLKLKAVMLEENRDEVYAMKRQSEELGVPGFRFNTIVTPRIDGKAMAPCSLSARDMTEVDAQDGERGEDWRRIHADWLAESKVEKKTERLFHCDAGKNSFNINPYGEVGLCNEVVWSKVSLRDKPFGEIWANDLKAHQQDRLPEGSPCAACEIAQFCDNCPAWRSLEGVGLGDAVPALCEIAKARNLRFGDPAARCGADILGYHRMNEVKDEVWEVA